MVGHLDISPELGPNTIMSEFSEEEEHKNNTKKGYFIKNQQKTKNHRNGTPLNITLKVGEKDILQTSIGMKGARFSSPGTQEKSMGFYYLEDSYQQWKQDQNPEG